MRIFDSLTGTERELEPREPGKVGIYACGPTVYGPVHVGNARPFVVFSLLKRFLSRSGYEVTFVANITDVNDKIYDAAPEGSSAELAEQMTARYVADTDRLELGRPDAEPRATASIDSIVTLIGDLIDSGHAYASGGDVYFRVRSFEDYGKLSNRPVGEMTQGEDDEGPKEDPLDFALWKAHKPGEDTAWDAPWGRGRPGWHIECSAMAEDILGVDFEIHGGGNDLIFPHHENEIAQTEAARGKPLARIWMHNGMLQFDREKMSKSVGNITTLAGAIDEYGRDALVMFFVRSHYRKPVDFSAEALEQAEQSTRRIRELGRRLDPAARAAAGPFVEEAEARFYAALADDFNTPAALTALFDLVAWMSRSPEPLSPGPLREMLWCLGLDGLLDPDEDVADAEAQRLLAEREEARAARDFATADARRDQLAALGWQVRDTPEGPRLVRQA